jgi:hypothetical protein
MAIEFRVKYAGSLLEPGECFVSATGVIFPRPEGQNSAEVEAASSTDVPRCPSQGSNASAIQQGGAALEVVELESSAVNSMLGRVHTCLVPLDPTLDDMLAASFVEQLASGGELPAGARAFADYAALARAGLRPGNVPLTESMEGIYLAIRNAGKGDLSDPATAATFFARWREFVELLLAAAAEGRDPYATSLVADTIAFRGEQLYLAADLALYQQDVERGERWNVSLLGGPPRASALLLRHPKSLLFKYWCREDRAAPCLGKYSLLAVTQADLAWVFSTDPTDRLSLLPLAEALQTAEVAATPSGAAPYTWYDGSRHNHTLIAAPREGTRLSDREVLRVARRWCRARPATRVRRTAILACGASLGILLIALLLGPWLRTKSVSNAAPNVGPEPKAAMADAQQRGLGIPDATSLELGDIQVRARALLFATNRYGDPKWPDLKKPLDDINALADILKRKYAFECEVVPNPDKETLLEAVNREAGRKYKPGDRLLVYVAGHGEFDAMQGYIVTRRPEGSTGKYDVLTSSGELEKALMRSECPHVLLALDICYGGAIFEDEATRGKRAKARAEDTRGPNFVSRMLSRRSRHVLTSGAKESVPDESGFARRMSDWLTIGSPNGILTTAQMYDALNQGDREPFPMFREVSGHEGGDFLFISAGVLERTKKPE